MDKVYLVVPSKEHEKAYLDMMSEWEEVGESIYPGSIRRKGMDYHEWLAYTESFTSKETCPPEYVTSDTYFLIKDDSRILGAINIRHYLNKNLLSTGGHIGYGIRPTERRKGYAKLMLKMALEKIEEIGIDEVLITCNKDNVASAKTIMANGGILENEVVEDNGNIVQRYWIQLS